MSNNWIYVNIIKVSTVNPYSSVDLISIEIMTKMAATS